MKYYIIAGEASGDLHGSNLIKELKNLDEHASVRCWGGDLMQQAGSELVKHYRDLAFMGFLEVLQNLPAILKNIKFCKRDILQFNPDVLVLIDYPGFNLRIAKWAKENGFKIIYYISPQVWAWKENRVKLVKKVVDKMLVILPFEKDFYSKWNFKVEYVGHPLLEAIEVENKKEIIPVKIVESEERSSISNTTEPKEIIALLPGSRKQEITKVLPLMLEASKKFQEYKIVIAQAPGLPIDLYLPLLKEFSNAELATPGQTYLLLRQSTAALVTSGTATLETALFGVPQVVCYKGSAFSYRIAKLFLKIKYISLVNLIMNKTVVTELVQSELTAENIIRELELIIKDRKKIEQVNKDYADLKSLLIQSENASKRAAKEIFTFLRPTS